MIKEIGSTYYLPPRFAETLPKRSLKRPDILKTHESYVSTCRSAIGLCLDRICVTRKVAMLPAFTCESVLDPFLKRGYEVFPYPIGIDLSIHLEEFLDAVDKVKPNVILTHSYFGFNTTESLRSHIEELRIRENIVFIEDMTQSMFSTFKPLSTNYHVGSIRKWMPVPDGAFTTVPYDDIEEDQELITAKMKAFTEKGDFLLNGRGDKETFRKDFVVAETILDNRERVYSMSSVSREIFATTDINKMKDCRWMNYDMLLTQVLANPILTRKIDVIFSELGTGICPFHFSVLVKEGRKELQQFLAKNDIYATVIWKCPKEFDSKINEVARYIYDHILCFHVDQRYDIDDMKRIISSLNDFYKIN